jgi:ribosomal protein S18 acetylase RimI-like enzyme
MEYRRATRDDVHAFVENRMEFLALIRTIEKPEEFRARTLEYIRAHIEKDDLIIWLALDQETIASSCMVCVFQTAPVPSCPNGRAAELLNVYTKEAYRRMGLAETLVRAAIAELEKRGVEKVLLDYTDDGLPLYQKLGFTILPQEMQLRLPRQEHP